jgi:hypothetical protein
MEMPGLLLWADKRGGYFHGPIAHCFEARRGLPPFSWMGHGPFPASPPALLSLTVVDGGGEPALLWEAAVMAGTGRVPSPFPSLST